MPAFMQSTEQPEKDSLMTEDNGGNNVEPTENDFTNRHLGRFAYRCIYRYVFTKGTSSGIT
ncbi:hypothetical protein VISI1226_09509 [Vibrio sinaloensis DSM 21326]|uniref:Uncharacterized protein n=1 Tax=Vibrio sinaloensis DSM 21326 TaxID=945550 RepID=E8M950_PHOS4|nr:hypothetical protein VISI1226_09509 [Vibrio sinaloensis DSM 21326]